MSSSTFLPKPISQEDIHAVSSKLWRLRDILSGKDSTKLKNFQTEIASKYTPSQEYALFSYSHPNHIPLLSIIYSNDLRILKDYIECLGSFYKETSPQTNSLVHQVLINQCEQPKIKTALCTNAKHHGSNDVANWIGHFLQDPTSAMNNLYWILSSPPQAQLSSPSATSTSSADSKEEDNQDSEAISREIETFISAPIDIDSDLFESYVNPEDSKETDPLIQNFQKLLDSLHSNSSELSSLSLFSHDSDFKKENTTHTKKCSL